MRISTLLAMLFLASSVHAADIPLILSVKSGPWSDPATWSDKKVPGNGAKVLIREGHRVAYDIKSDAVIRGLNIAGALSFTPDKDTLLNVGLIKIQPGDEYSEDGFDCDGHSQASDSSKPKPAAPRWAHSTSQSPRGRQR